ncbi:MoaD/ThiS family protein [Foetidibacter luteolus]|uniref:MoaD/ThiS family protein n=1 Tax=Foetidibacter luteolus TaxID=2608880 RepID=UPI00129BC4FD|nr:MoaD/ThiS family protein [Foetidibacter luteolus]
MKVKVLAFGIAKEIFGSRHIEVDMAEAANVQQLKAVLEQQFPRLKQLASYLVAVNDEYAEGPQALGERDEVAVIPPVSGG